MSEASPALILRFRSSAAMGVDDFGIIKTRLLRWGIGFEEKYINRGSWKGIQW